MGLINAVKLFFWGYNTLILTHLNYCILVWGAKTTSLFSFWNYAVRILTNNIYLSHTEIHLSSKNTLLGIYKLHCVINKCYV